MLRSAVKMVWIVLLAFSCTICIFSVLQEVQAQWPPGSGPDNLDFGWFASGIHAPGSEPVCKYCVNGFAYDLTYVNESAADLLNGLFWNHTVGMYRCDGVQMNEMWAYDEPSSSIVFGNLTNILCIDAVTWDSEGLLKLRPCNLSVATQRWKLEGNLVISGLTGSSGEPLFMVGQFPNMEINRTSQRYEFMLNLSSSLPSISGQSDVSYTSNFTFLSGKNLIDRSTNTFTAEGMLLIGNSSVDHIVNGGFENSTIQAGDDITWSDYGPKVPSYFALCGWVIYGALDYVKSGFLQAAEGSSSIHLNTYSDKAYASTITQTFTTQVGTEYLLSFFFNGFPPHLLIASRPTWLCSATYNEARLQVVVTNATSSNPVVRDGTVLVQKFSLNVANANRLNFGVSWQLQTMSFTASTNVTAISFGSLNFNNSCGPMIDEVKLYVNQAGGSVSVP